MAAQCCGANGHGVPVSLLRKITTKPVVAHCGENFKIAIRRENPGRPESLLGPPCPAGYCLVSLSSRVGTTAMPSHPGKRPLHAAAGNIRGSRQDVPGWV